VCVGTIFSTFVPMKQETVGQITKSGGFSRLVHEVVDTGEPIEILRNNESVAVIFPSTKELTQIFEQSMEFGRVLTTIDKRKDDDESLSTILYLIGQYMLGLQAKMILGLSYPNSPVSEMENVLVNSIRLGVGVFKRFMDEELYQKISTEEAGNVGVQPVAPSRGAKTKAGAVKRSPIRKKKK